MTPPRLNVVFAARAPVAAILLRGPSAWYHVVAWNTVRDTFDHGAWFKGRIYEDRCGLSPDGELFVYFALKGNHFNTSYRGTWTAVSRLPWLHALALWPCGDTWSGGGWFDGDRSVVLQTGSRRTHPDHRGAGLAVTLGPRSGCRSPPPVPAAQWSGYDQSGAVVHAMDGKLFRMNRGVPREIADFNGLAPAPEAAPDWARAPAGKRVLSRRSRRKRRNLHRTK